MSLGYFRFPTVFRDRVVFVSEDDLWEVALEGGIPRRLTAGRGSSLSPRFSPDGRQLAFSSAEEGHSEVYIMRASGGEIRRLTYLGGTSVPCGWLDGETVLFRSSAFEAHTTAGLCTVGTGGGLPRPLQLGPATSLVVSETGHTVLARQGLRGDPSNWKRYRGGTAGKLWIAPAIDKEYKLLIQLNGNLACPIWADARVYFLSDHEGVANLYSCTADGSDLRLEARHQDYYLRNPATDGRTIVYHAGGDLYALDVASRTSKKLAVAYRSQRTQRQRRYVDPAKYLEAVDLDAKGEQCAFSVRGQLHQMRHWDGPVVSQVVPGRRYRLGRFLADARRVVAVADWDYGDERPVIWDTQADTVTPVALAADDGAGSWGRFTQLEASPKGDRFAYSNHRNELWSFDLSTATRQRLAVNAFNPIGSFAWSPDGRWIAFQQSADRHQYYIAIANVDTGAIRAATKPLFTDYAPSFDRNGRYLYFLSDRILNPVYDSVQFDLSFPRTAVPCLVTLRKDVPSPFLDAASPGPGGAGDSPAEDREDAELEIDFDGIEERILAFPAPEGLYSAIAGLRNKAVWLSLPLKGALKDDAASDTASLQGSLEAFDFRTMKVETLASGVSSFRLSADGSVMALNGDRKLRVVKAGAKVEAVPGSTSSTPETGWIDLQRLKILVEPEAEWKQMLHEAWRLQRDHFWRADMGRLDWDAMLARYRPLAERINSRSEFADLIWELQGELGTSHAHEHGGDYREEPSYPIGFLGAEFSWDEAAGGYRIARCLRGDPWSESEACPLRAPGVQLGPGDVVTAVNGQTLSADVTPQRALMNLAGAEVRLTVKAADGPRQVRVRTLKSEKRVRYRDWVERNRNYVREATRGRAGYIHIPDMLARGYSEFHRHFMRDYDRDGLIVDVRYNSGGHVALLLLEKLCRQRVGAVFTRWFGVRPVPDESPAGPLVALTNEFTASDGDIFSHTFKMRKAGPVIGRRTWGGVVGISPRHRLVDGGTTTQPEFARWFSDVGWKIENYGIEPDIDVDIAPHEFRQGADPQLDRGISELLKLLEMRPPFRALPEDDPRQNLGGRS